MNALRNSTSYHSLAVDHGDAQADATHIAKSPSPGNAQQWKTKLRSFTRWTLTPLGFLITLYGLNIIAWGGMLFLLLCNAAPQMCNPDCNSADSARRIWIEIDSQILNALFCVTGFGLAPWRIRDVYLWSCWRLGTRKQIRERGLERLAKVHANWFVKDTDGSLLPVSDNNSMGDQDETRSLERGSGTPTPSWKLDVVVWGNMLNTVFQICLAVCMWAMNRFTRPSWTTGLFVGLACGAAAVPGIVMWLEKKRVKKESEHPGALLLVPRNAGGKVPGQTVG
ncbi:hypothetical protein BJX68DRAFT_278081 [Aspergillus pseudodeflectus]|uniref:Uncharacterized protein n=1 Tax=Aspergillus pseudodeflectus TaxID=176178 RepID=A0ABR4JT60_9EURO